MAVLELAYKPRKSGQLNWSEKEMMPENNFTSTNDMSPEEAKASVLDFINQMANLKAAAGTHKPILKSLEDLGVPVINKMVEINGEERNCVVIPVSDLLLREYEVITGYNASGFTGNDAPQKHAQSHPVQQAPVRYSFDQMGK